MAYAYGLSSVTITNDGTGASFSGVATEVSFDNSANPIMLHGIPINDASATWSVYPRDAIPGAADSRVRVTIQGANPSLLSYVLKPEDFNAFYTISGTTADGQSFSVDNLKLVSISGRTPYETYTEVTVEFARVVIEN
jgi:hypothetical protein